MPPKKKPNLQQQKTNKIAKELIKMNQRADEFRALLKLEPVPIIDINGNIIDKIE